MSKFDKHFRMNEQDAINYIVEKLDFFAPDADLKATEIGDGNINYVFKVWDERSGQSIILKHADVVLRSSGRALDVDRNRIEALILKIQSQLAPGFVPHIYKYDPTMCVVVMEDVSEYRNLRYELLDQKIFPTLAEDIATFMVNTLLPTTDLVLSPDQKKKMVKEFINIELCDISEDLVLTEPYNDYKGRNILLDDNREFVKQHLYQDQALIGEVCQLKTSFMNNAQALLHGDLHTGSIFANQNGIKVLDPEFAFYGPMGYDIGNVIANLIFPLVRVTTADNGADSKKFSQYLIKTITQIVDQFKAKFITLYKEKVTDTLRCQPQYRDTYLAAVLSDSAGFAGLEIIRRTVGDSKVVDITGIDDLQHRIRAERTLIKLGKELIMGRNGFQNGGPYRDLINKYLL